MATETPLISTLLLNFNRAHLLEVTLKSYLQTINVPHELCILDNASTDGSQGIIARYAAQYPHIRAVYLEENIGGEAFNLALPQARGALVHFSENDQEYLPGWDDHALEAFRAFDDLGQLSLHAPAPTAEEVWKTKPATPETRAGVTLHLARRVGTTSLIRRGLAAGLRVGNLEDGGSGHKLPHDRHISDFIAQKGAKIAFSDRYYVRNLGHFYGELMEHFAYYRETYRLKPAGEEGLSQRLRAWRRAQGLELELISVHVPKCGGTALELSLKQAYGDAAFFRDRDDSPLNPSSPINLDPEGYREKHARIENFSHLRGKRVVHGHFHVSKYRAFPDVAKITFLRDPVDRLISHYYFWKNYPPHQHPLHDYTQERALSLLEFARLPFLRYFYTGVFFREVDMGIFDYIGNDKTMNEDMRRLSGLLAKPLTMQTANTNAFPGYRAKREEAYNDRATMAGLRGLLSRDIAFYETWAGR